MIILQKFFRRVNKTSNNENFNRFSYFYDKNGIRYKIGGSGSGKTRFFRKPPLKYSKSKLDERSIAEIDKTINDFFEKG